MTSMNYADSLLGRLEEHAAELPDQAIYTFLHDLGESQTLTYGQLLARVRAIAARVGELLRPGDRAVLLYPHGLEFICTFLGCLAAGVVAVPANTPSRNRKRERLTGIIKDCCPSALLTTSATRSSFPSELAIIPRFATDEWPTVDAPPWDTGLFNPDDLAFLQYTSGSTGNPRGVMITHGNIASNERQIQIAFGHSPRNAVDRTPLMVTWLPLFHDMGLIGGVLQPLYVGFPSVLLSPATFLRTPQRWLKAISEYRATTAGAPNFAYELCVKTVKESDKADLDLSSLRVLFNGAEPVRAETIERFTHGFQQCGFRNLAFFPCYGLAEATLFVTGGPQNAGPSRLCVNANALGAGSIDLTTNGSHPERWLVGSGYPGEGVTVVVVDPVNRATLPDGEIGELWVSSPGVGAGYYGRPEETNRVFGNRLSTGEGPFLNTGDLGFLESGQVYVTGRSKDIIILSGRNVYPQDVESAVESAFPSIGPNSCAAFGVELNGQERLIVIVEADRDLMRAARVNNSVEELQNRSHAQQVWDLIDQVCHAIMSETEVTVQSLTFVRTGTFLRTSSGKVQRRATHAAYIAGELDIVFAWDARTPSRLSRPASIPSSIQTSEGIW